MRKWIIDTDTASDDCAALLLAASQKDIEILGVTVVTGNVGLHQAADNALMTLEVCGCDAPVYLGAERPLVRERQPTISVHGKDGMGDMDLIHPTCKPADERAVDFILRMVRKYPGEVEIITLGPATNVALAILTDRTAMAGVKRIYSMGTCGFGHGIATPVAEFNVFIDAEAYGIMLDSGLPITIAGFDMCMGDIALNKDDLAALACGSKSGQFLEKVTRKLLQFNRETRGLYQTELPDAVAIAAAIWDDFILDYVDCHCYCCINDGPTYGQVIFYRKDRIYEAVPAVENCNVTLITKVDAALFKRRLLAI